MNYFSSRTIAHNRGAYDAKRSGRRREGGRLRGRIAIVGTKGWAARRHIVINIATGRGRCGRESQSRFALVAVINDSRMGKTAAALRASRAARLVQHEYRADG